MSQKERVKNPYHPIDPMWHIVEARLRKKEYEERNDKLVDILESLRRKNMAFIFTVPKSTVNETQDSLPTKKEC